MLRHAQDRRNAGYHASGERSCGIARQREAEGLLRPVRLVEHHEDEIAWVVHREYRAKRGYQLVLVAVAAETGLLRRARLAAHVVTRHVGLLARPVGDDVAQQ